VIPELRPLYCEIAGSEMQRNPNIHNNIFFISQSHPRA
jgi:hypothetical protein